jgi:flagellar basal body-associated protein FliL
MQEERKMSSQKFVWWKIILLLLIVALLIVGGYVAYVFLTYSRIEDKVDLTVEGNAQEPAKTGK